MNCNLEGLEFVWSARNLLNRIGHLATFALFTSVALSIAEHGQPGSLWPVSRAQA